MTEYSKQFAEDFTRAVYVLGKIDAQQLYQLTPQILKLKAPSNDPITVYIDSYGGETRHAEMIRRLLQGGNQKSGSTRIITVVRNIAASAAADLLALGDYAIAYTGCNIHYHGTRRAVDDLTSEVAAVLAQDLEQTNAAYALRLARKAFGRSVFHYGNLTAEFPALRAMVEREIKEKGENRAVPDLECFAYALFQRLSSSNDKIPRRAFVQHEKAKKLVEYVLPKLPEKFDSLEAGQAEAAILSQVLAFELETAKSPDWSLSSGGMSQTTQDFMQLLDYVGGKHRGYLDRLLEEFGALLVPGEKWDEFVSIRKGSAEDRLKWLNVHVRPAFEPLWYFTVCLCRLLQRGENSMTAEDAYWLGIVDEVVGSDLPNLRILLEADSGNG